jgi:hypothetical protein
MVFVTLIVIFFALRYVSQKAEEKLKADRLSNVLVVADKKCPPHAWEWQVVVNQSGEKIGERIVCKACGPLSSLLEKQ